MRDATVWVKFECGGGSRWTATKGPGYRNDAGQVCNFSGCNCRTKISRAGETTDLDEASAWFKRGGANAARA